MLYNCEIHQSEQKVWSTEKKKRKTKNKQNLFKLCKS